MRNALIVECVMVFALAATSIGKGNLQQAAARTLQGQKGKTLTAVAGGTSHLTRTPEAEDNRPNMEPLKGYGQLPLSFEANVGQSPSGVKFLARGRGYGVFLTSKEAILKLGKTNSKCPTDMRYAQNWYSNRQLQAQKAGEITQLRIPSFGLREAGKDIDHGIAPDQFSFLRGSSASESPNRQANLLRLGLVGANANPRVKGLDELPGKSNYFLGRDSRKWRTGISNYAKVEYEDIYPGIDLIYYGRHGQLEQDFVVRPGADPKLIRLAIGGTGDGRFDAQGNLILDVAGGRVVQRTPLIYQMVGGARKEISGGYFVKEDEIGFQVAAYDSQRALIIDPVLSYSSYLGGSSSQGGVQIATDISGNAYVAGFVDSIDFPIAHALQPEPGGGAGRDGFVSKLSQDGSHLVYSTYLGGSGFDIAYDVAVDAIGNAYVSGITGSSDFPTVNPMQQSLSGPSDAFVAKLNSTGSGLIYSTYLGGSGEEGGPSGTAIGLDSFGNAYVTGTTDSADFPVNHPLQPIFGGFLDIFVTKLSSTGSASLYSTYLGTAGFDAESHIAVDIAGNACVLIGLTDSDGFSTTPQAAQGTDAGGGECFVAKLNPSGSAFVYATYLGGSGDETGFDIAMDVLGNAYVTGHTASPDFPTVQAFQPHIGGGECLEDIPGGPTFTVPCPNAFVTKINAAGTRFLYSTYLGGNGFDFGRSIAVDIFQNAYVTGFANSTNFPVADPSQPSPAGNTDAFVTKFSRSGSALQFSTYLGGSGVDDGSGIATDATGSIYVTGATFSTDFPTLNAIQSSGSGFDVFVTKFREVVTFDSIAKAIQQLTVDGLINNQAISQSLLHQLTEAAKALESGNPATARNILRAMASHVKAQSGKHIDPIAAQALLQLITALVL